MTWWHDDINDQQRVNAIASRNATRLRSKRPRDINWDSVIERFQQTITEEKQRAIMRRQAGDGRYRKVMVPTISIAQK
jgi:hypothetical protein